MALPDALVHLLDPAAYPHPVDSIRLIETHISWVLLAGEFAYKIKKPLNLGFLDFSTLEKRRFCCEEEIRLNRRLAPDTYLAVVAVTERGVVDDGKLLDWAVQMRAFPADATLDRETTVTPEQIDAIADQVAGFHGECALAPWASEFGSTDAVIGPVRENLRQLAEHGLTPIRQEQLAQLEAWSEQECQRLHAHFVQRKQSGHVRECHGDLHLGNIAWVNDAPLIFDCLEFNPDLRFIDVTSEIAFLCMDLFARRLDGVAWRFLNRYLEHTGDYAGMAAFRFYLVYRALVRAKVAAIRASQGDRNTPAELEIYLDLAESLQAAAQPALLLMHGFSGSGKTWLSQRVLETFGAVRLRSDVERKRLFNLSALADSRAVGDIYTPEAGHRTFARLRELADWLLAENYRVIVDATFLGVKQRASFIDLALARQTDWRILSVSVDVDTLRERISQRIARANDASEADLSVLDSQMSHANPLDQRERAHQIVYADEADWPGVLAELRQINDRPASPGAR